MDDAVRDVTLLPSDDVALALGVDPTMGLGPAEVVARREVHGPNELRSTPRTPCGAGCCASSRTR